MLQLTTICFGGAVKAGYSTMYNKYLSMFNIHFACGFGAHQGRQTSIMEHLTIASFKSVYPSSTFHMWTTEGSHLNLPGYVQRHELKPDQYEWKNGKGVKGQHLSDRARLQALKQCGGLYVDAGDTFAVLPFDFESKCQETKLYMGVIGACRPKLCNNIIWCPYANMAELYDWEHKFAEAFAAGHHKWDKVSCQWPTKEWQNSRGKFTALPGDMGAWNSVGTKEKVWSDLLTKDSKQQMDYYLNSAYTLSFNSGIKKNRAHKWLLGKKYANAKGYENLFYVFEQLMNQHLPAINVDLLVKQDKEALTNMFKL